jgi:hypothetical protein
MQGRTAMACSLLAAALAILLGSIVGPAHGETSPRRESTMPARTGIAIRSIIPHRRVGDEICYAATFSGRGIDMQDWAAKPEEIVPGADVDGKPVTRNGPAPLPDQDISRLAPISRTTTGNATAHSISSSP